MTHQKSKRRFQVDQEHRTEDNWASMIHPLLVSLIAFNLLQAKHLLIETEDNSEAEPMTKEEVEALLSVIPEEAKEIYNHLNKTEKNSFQRKMKNTHGDVIRAVRYTISIVVVFLLQLFTKQPIYRL